FSLEDIITLPLNNLNLTLEEDDESYEEFDSFTEEVEEHDDTQYDIKDHVKDKKSVIHNFHNDNYEFISSHQSVKGSVDSFHYNKDNYLRIEYDIQNNNEIKRAYIDMTKQNIEFRYPIIKLDLIIKSFDYASGNLGVRLMTQDGKNIDTIISE